MKSIQELKDDLINTVSSPSRLYTVVGKEEFDALMNMLEASKGSDCLVDFLIDLHRDLQLRRDIEIHKASGLTAFTKGWLYRTGIMLKQLRSILGEE